MKVAFALGLFTLFTNTLGYFPSSFGKLPLSASAFHHKYSMDNDMLRDVMQRIIKDLTYVDEDFSIEETHSDRSDELEHPIPLDYERMAGTGMDEKIDLHTNLRDQEFLHHSSLWGGQYVGENGEGKQRVEPLGSASIHQGIKTDGTLPAYCNPPNPCPYLYTAEMGCLEQFENTASFSRRYQAVQECMCDTEHMFECSTTVVDEHNSRNIDHVDNELNDVAFDQFIQRTIQMNPAFQHKNLVAKKYNQISHRNPFLAGEKLTTAAKKGNGISY